MNLLAKAMPLLLATAASALAMDGAYVGAQLGHNHFADRANIKGLKKETLEHNLGYALFSGYGKKIDDFYLGAELAIGNGYPSKRHTARVGAAPNNRTGYRYEKGVTLGASLKAGYFVLPGYLLYGKVAIERSKDKAIVYIADIMPMNVTKTVFNIVPGIGVEKIMENHSVKLEYSRDLSKNIKYDDKHSFGYTNHQVKVGFSVKV